MGAEHRVTAMVASIELPMPSSVGYLFKSYKEVEVGAGQIRFPFPSFRITSSTAMNET